MCVLGMISVTDEESKAASDIQPYTYNPTIFNSSVEIHLEDSLPVLDFWPQGRFCSG